MSKTLEDLLVCQQPRLEESIEVKHKFTKDERLQLLDEITEADSQLKTAEEGKDAAMAEWKSTIKELETERAAVSKQAREGFEMRPTDCLVILNPKGKVKYYHDKETLERVDTKPMTQDDYQMQLKFERDHGEAEVDEEGED